MWMNLLPLSCPRPPKMTKKEPPAKKPAAAKPKAVITYEAKNSIKCTVKLAAKPVIRNMC
jgi:hypothetical protein